MRWVGEAGRSGGERRLGENLERLGKRKGLVVRVESDREGMVRIKESRWVKVWSRSGRVWI